MFDKSRIKKAYFRCIELARELYKNLYKLNPICLMVITLFGMTVLPAIIKVIIPEKLAFFISNGPDINHGIIYNIIVLCIIGPIQETLCYFAFINKILNSLLKKKSVLLYIVVSSIIFGSMHFYNLQYILWATFTGLFMAIEYSIAYRKNERPIIQVSIVHGVRNLISLILVLLAK